MRIVELRPDDVHCVQQVAALLVEAFAHTPDFVKTTEEALSEVQASFGSGRVSLVAVDEYGDAIGWIGGIEQYDGRVYELHPLAVRPSAQHQGIGRALTSRFEAEVRRRGALTVLLGTDDDFNGTSLFGVDVYPDVCAHIQGIRNIANHPFEFYLKCGYAVVGLVPDADGFGKPDILMAKRVGELERGQEGAR